MRGRATLMPCTSFRQLILQCQHVKIMLSPCSCPAVAFGGFLENSKPSGPALCFKRVGLLKELSWKFLVFWLCDLIFHPDRVSFNCVLRLAKGHSDENCSYSVDICWHTVTVRTEMQQIRGGEEIRAEHVGLGDLGIWKGWCLRDLGPEPSGWGWNRSAYACVCVCFGGSGCGWQQKESYPSVCKEAEPVCPGRDRVLLWRSLCNSVFQKIFFTSSYDSKKELKWTCFAFLCRVSLFVWGLSSV